MRYKEIQFDLFDVNSLKVKAGEEPYCLAHCISADFGMYSGIVTGFNERWNLKNLLIEKLGDAIETFCSVGGHAIPVEVIQDGVKFTIYNLITKKAVYSQPTYLDILKALKSMKAYMVERHQTRLAIPLLGCGIDGKDWKVVSTLVKNRFANTNTDILVCRRDL